MQSIFGMRSNDRRLPEAMSPDVSQTMHSRVRECRVDSEFVLAKHRAQN